MYSLTRTPPPEVAVSVRGRCAGCIVGFFGWGSSPPAQDLVGRLVGGYGTGVSSGIRAGGRRLPTVGSSWRMGVGEEVSVMSGSRRSKYVLVAPSSEG